MIDAVAQARELQKHRLAAWVGREAVCGRVVRPFTLRAWVVLIESNNAFVSGSIPLTGDVLQILWLIDERFDGYSKPDADWLRDTARLCHVQAVDEISRYLARALADIPRGGAKSSSMEIASFVAYWVHRFASAYGWTIDYVMSQPLQQLIQLERVGREAAGDGSAQQTDLVLAMIRKQQERSDK